VDDPGAGSGDKAIDALRLLNRNGRNGFTEAFNLVGIEYRCRPGEQAAFRIVFTFSVGIDLGAKRPVRTSVGGLT
jgi:hypothetical protein